MQLAPLGISLGASLGTSLLGRMFQPKPTAAQTNATNLLGQTQQYGQTAGQGLVGQGTQALSQPINYWSSILSGNRGAATSAMAPEINRIGQGYTAAASSSAALNPRGGPGSTFLADMPFEKQRDVSTLLQGARPAAANSLAGAGSTLLSQGTNLISSATGAGRDILSSQLQQRQQEMEQGGKLGAGLFSMIQTYGFPALAKAYPDLFGSLAKSGVNSNTGGI